MADYLTLQKRARAEFTVNKSRFIGTAAPVCSNEEALAFVNEIRKEFPDARHNVFAYAVREPEYARFSDDGEPSGTAGKPVLDVLRATARPLTDAVIVVTRYFGGILLGTGGLVRAYSEGARIAVEAAGIVKMCQCTVFDVSVPYNYYERFSRLIEAHGGVTEQTDFADAVRFILRLPVGRAGAFAAAATDLTNGAVAALSVGEKYDAFPLGEGE